METQITTSNAITLSTAARLCAIDGRAPDTSTVWRWCRKGLHGVHLRYARIGRKMVTSRDAVEQFMRELAEADNPAPYQHIDRDDARAACAELGI